MLENDRYIEPGSIVRRNAIFVGDDGEHFGSEWGVVRECWWNAEMGFHDCRVQIFFHSDTSGEIDASQLFTYAACTLADTTEQVAISGKEP